MGIWGGKCPKCWDDPCHCHDHVVASPKTVIEIVKASKRKCKHQRDNWKARALVYRGALEKIAARSLSCANNRNEVIWAREALADGEKIGKDGVNADG